MQSRAWILAATLVALLVSGCDGEDEEQPPEGSDRERIRQVVEESEADTAQAHDGEVEKWCDTRLVLPLREIRPLFERLQAGMRGPAEETQLGAAAGMQRCLEWANALAEQLRKVDEDELESPASDIEIERLKIHGATARATVYSGEGENRGVRTWKVVELTKGDWRVLQEAEVPTIVPAPD